MKRIILIAFILFYSFCVSQNTKPKLYLATFNELASFAGDYLGDCRLSAELEIFRGQTVAVTSVIEYDNCDKKDYCEFYYNGKKYFADVAELEFAKGDLHDLIMLRYDVKDSVRTIAQKYSEKSSIEIIKKAESKIALYKKRGKENGILIKKSQVFDQSEYTEGTGYEFSFINTSKKTIKYIWVTVKGINAVNDAVSSKTLKGVGLLYG